MYEISKEKGEKILTHLLDSTLPSKEVQAIFKIFQESYVELSPPGAPVEKSL